MHLLALFTLWLLQGAAAQRFGWPQEPHHREPYEPRPPRPAQWPQRPGPGLSMAPHFPSYGDGALGAPCDYDDDCAAMEHTYCRSQQTCECKMGYRPSSAGDRCLATVGARCTTKYDCSGLPSGDCVQRVCDCTAGYVPTSDGSCVKGALRVGDECDLDLQCEELGEGSICNAEARCQCAPGKHDYNGRCFANRGLNEPCSDKGECYIGEGYQGIITCQSGLCKCQDHYQDMGDGKCTSGSGRLRAAMTSIAVLLIICII